jgi:hypothetical protein
MAQVQKMFSTMFWVGLLVAALGLRYMYRSGNSDSEALSRNQLDFAQ